MNIIKSHAKALISIITIIILATILPIAHITVNADSNDYPDGDNIWKTDTDTGNYQVQPLEDGNTIYYSIDTDQNNKYYQIWETAVQNWNNLGVIHLQQTSDSDPRKQITLTGNYEYHKHLYRYLKSIGQADQYANEGNESNQFYKNPVNNNYEYMYKDTTASFEPGSWNVNYKTLINIADHEIGHTLGFGHDPAKVHGKHVTMCPYSNAYNAPLGNHEKQMLLKKYGTFLNQPASSYYNDANAQYAASQSNQN